MGGALADFLASYSGLSQKRRGVGKKEAHICSPAYLLVIENMHLCYLAQLIPAGHRCLDYEKVSFLFILFV